MYWSMILVMMIIFFFISVILLINMTTILRTMMVMVSAVLRIFLTNWSYWDISPLYLPSANRSEEFAIYGWWGCIKSVAQYINTPVHQMTGQGILTPKIRLSCSCVNIKIHASGIYSLYGTSWMDTSIMNTYIMDTCTRMSQLFNYGSCHSSDDPRKTF